MNKKTISAIVLISGILSIILGFNHGTFLGGLYFISIGIVSLIWASRLSKQYQKEENFKNNNDNEYDNKDESTTKLCKYCKSEIPIDAKVCPNCRKTQNFSIGRVFIGLIIGSIILYFIFVANNDAPLSVRKFVCGIGLRDDYPYCYYIDTDKLNEILDKYK